MIPMTDRQLLTMLKLPTGHKFQLEALAYVDAHEITDINLLFEAASADQRIIDEFNKRVSTLDEKKRDQCTIYPTDSGNQIRKKCKKAKVWGLHYAPVWDRYVNHQPDTGDSGSEGGVEGGGEAGGLGEAMSSTERVRRYYKRHPEKVRKYLKKTQKDRVARNRDRRKAVKKHGKAKMKNHDVHHPNGPHGGKWRLAKKDHGPDKKKKKNEVASMTGMLLLEAAPGSHVMHPYDDPNMKFSEFKDIITQATSGDFGGDATEKYDGQTLLFTVKDGKARFARNTQHTKNYGEGTMTADEYKQYFSGHGDKISKVFAQAAKDVDAALSKVPKEELEKIFGKGDKFVLSELLSTELPNTIPYASDRVVMLNIRRYDPATGNPDNAPIDRFAADKVVDLIKKHSDPNAGQFKLSGNTKLQFDTPDQPKFDKKRDEYMQEIDRLQKEAGVSDTSTLGDYFAKKWNDLLDSTGLKWTPEERKALQDRWVNGNKAFGSKDITDPTKKEAFRKIEGAYKEHLVSMTEPLKTVTLKAGTDAVNRSSNVVSKNDGTREKLIATLGKAVTAIKNSGNAEYIKKTKEQLDQLKKLGSDSIIPSEGLILQRGGKLYKLTGSFTPVNQVVGLYTYKLNAVRAEPTTGKEPTKAPAKKKEPVSKKPKQPQTKKRGIALPLDKKAKLKGVMNARITNPDTGNQILVKTALKYDPHHPAYTAARSLVQKNLVKEHLLLEGGNAVAANSKIPNRFAQSTTKYASKMLGLDKLEKQLVGTTEKPVMGDLDVAVDMEDMRNLAGYHGIDNKELFAKLKPIFADKGLEITYTPGFQQFSVLSPLVDDQGNIQKAYDKDGKEIGDEGKVQVDFMMGNLPWMKRWLTNGSTSKYSSTFRNILVIDTFGSMIFDTEDPEVKWKYQINAKSGLERIEFKELPNGKKQVLKKELVSTDVDTVAKVLLGNKAKFSDMDTFEKFNDKVKAPDSPFKDFAPKIYDRFIKSLKNFDKEIPAEVPSSEPNTDSAPKKQTPIAIYPGRFQPYHAGHHVTYDALVQKFGKENVYIATSDKTDALTSPFNFKDKQEIIMKMFDVPEDKIIQVKNTYNPQEILSKFPENTPAVFAVGEKDADRLSGGKYFSMYDEDEPMQGHKNKGYVWVGPPPNIEIQGRTISGTELRNIMGNPNVTDEVKEEIFTKVYGKFDPSIFKKVVSTTTESEKAVKLTKQHGKEKTVAKKTAVKPDATAKKQKAIAQEPKDPSFYKAGETWQTTGGNFGGKNKKSQIKYFATQDKAKQFATK